jgi:hypothetical protein
MATENMLTIARQIQMHYKNGELTEQQYKVLFGLIAHNDHMGALKGMHKILRRNKNEQRKAD